MTELARAIEPVSMTLLERLAALAPPPPPAPEPRSSGQAFDLDRFIGSHLQVRSTKEWNNARVWMLEECPFNPEHNDKSAVIGQYPSGAIWFTCHHNSCGSKRWSDVREMLEPRAERALSPLSHLQIVPKTSNGSNGNGHTETAETAETEPPGGFPLTDLGNAERLVALHGEDLRYVQLWGRYLWWDGTRWKDDTTGEASRRAKATVRSIYQEAQAIDDPDRRQVVYKHAVRSESGARIREMLHLAQADGAIALEPAAFDTEPMLLTCPNGTLDLRTGNLREHRRTDYSRKSVAVPYDPAAKAPVWERSIRTWMNGNAELIAFLKRALGYSLTGSTREEVLFLLWGLGRNGKSKFLAGARHVLGDYGQTVRPEALMVRQGSDIPNEIASLLGARMVTTIEVEEGSRLAESLVKQLTGGDTVSARFMRQEFFEFRPVMKVWMAGNHKPGIRGTDLAMWERILTIPFEVTIPAEERDKELEAKLQAEGQGILTWMVEGCLEWQRDGLMPPDEVKQATQEYRSEMDILGQFIEDCCENRDAAVIPAATLYERYESWVKTYGERQWSQQLFGRKLRERGYESSRTTGGLRVWEGLDVREPRSVTE